MAGSINGCPKPIIPTTRAHERRGDVARIDRPDPVLPPEIPQVNGMIAGPRARLVPARPAPNRASSSKATGHEHPVRLVHPARPESPENRTRTTRALRATSQARQARATAAVTTVRAASSVRADDAGAAVAVAGAVATRR
ncbi:hypothetical protein NCCP2495_31340 [Dietzia sp. NCCP-2495]|nr:hypothetical protein NCCP2495_31340 [Dietzia sp. NCCP-2495]